MLIFPANSHPLVPLQLLLEILTFRSQLCALLHHLDIVPCATTLPSRSQGSVQMAHSQFRGLDHALLARVVRRAGCFPPSTTVVLWAHLSRPGCNYHIGSAGMVSLPVSKAGISLQLTK